jgi:phosphoglycerate kinase
MDATSVKVSASKGLRGIKKLSDLPITEGKNVFLRLDLNVPISDGKITDENRIQASLPTIQYILERQAKLVMASHLGRPRSNKDVEYSLEPVARKLTELLKKEVILVEDPASEAVKALLTGLRKDQVILLENLRFDEQETKNGEDFAQAMASYTDVYVNDAFGASHRAHASIDALPRLVEEKGIGFLIEKEISFLDQLLESPKHPYVAVLGGVKVSDKIPVIEKLIDLVDGIVVGGAMAYTFLKAQSVAVGGSKVESEKLNYAREMIARMEARNKPLLLPVDHVIAQNFDSNDFQVSTGATISEGFMGLDIGPKTIQLFTDYLKKAETIFWNGPMGVFENPVYSKGTFAVAKALAENTGTKIVGGGDSAAAAQESGFKDQMTHISTGGGASLEYLQGDKLPGLEVLRVKVR